MARTTRTNNIKQDPGATDLSNANHARNASRAISITSAAPTATMHSPIPAQMSSSGDTVPDQDVSMGDVNGNGSQALLDDTDDAMSGADGTVNSDTISNEPAPIDGVHKIGKHAKYLFDVIKQLELLGIQAALPSLPKFVVVGDQSAGKSSIIEAACGINLPRSSGTCTKCPYQIRTTASSDGAWSCKVYLHQSYRFDRSFRAGRDRNRYDHWSKLDKTERQHFKTVHSKEDLEDVLRRAQVAILNPYTDPATYLYNSEALSESVEVEFSPNVISLEVSGPDLPELSFYDLPGAINATAKDEDQYLVGFVEKLVKNYVGEEEALILLACSMDVDLETSTASKWVREMKATKRCMGVLTKPDIMDRSRWPTIDKVLRGNGFSLGLGYFVTKQLSQIELDSGITHGAAREREQQFFEGNEPWCTIFATLKDKIGIPNLQVAISRELAVHIKNSIPEIAARIETRLDVVCKELENYTVRSETAMSIIIKALANLAQKVAVHIRADATNNQFRAEYKALVHALLVKLGQIRPVVILDTPGYTRQSFALSSDDEGTTGTPTPQRPAKKRNFNGVALPVRNSPAARTPQSARDTNAGNANAASTEGVPPTYKLDDIQKAYEMGSSSSLPNQLNPKVTEMLCLQGLSDWQTHVDAFFRELRKMVLNMLMTSIDDSFAAHGRTELYKETRNIARKYLGDLVISQVDATIHTLKCERHKPIAYGRTLLALVKKPTVAKLEADRLECRASEYFDTQELECGKVIPIPQRKTKMKEEAFKNAIGPDSYIHEIAALGTILGYYDLASARFVDKIASTLEHDLLHTISTDLQDKLIVGLQLKDEESCAQLLAEDPERERERVRKTTEKEKLIKALEEVNSLPNRSLDDA